MAITNSMKEQGENTRKRILESGLKLWPDVTPSSIAADLGITHAAVLYHFENVKDAVAQYALDSDYSPVIVQMIASNHKFTRGMKGSERLRHFTKCATTQDSPCTHAPK